MSNIKRKNIEENSCNANINWWRENTPYTTDRKGKWIDSVEFPIKHKGVEKLEQNIEKETEYIMCFVSFEKSTGECEGIYLSVRDEEYFKDDVINSNILDEEEKNILISFALSAINKERRVRKENQEYLNNLIQARKIRNI